MQSNGKRDRKRLDILLVEKGLAESRHKAQALIMAGQVIVDGDRVVKPGREVLCTADVSVRESLRYVSRGGLKLEAALDGFGLDPAGLSVLDAGASTGGFTDCLLQRGAARIIAADVGYGQLDWRMRTDPRVTVLERTNIRLFQRESLPHAVDGIVADLSFISLGLVLPRFAEILPERGWVVALVKPQFEVGRGDVGKHGVVRDPAKIEAAVASVKAAAEVCSFEVLGELESPIRGPKGNREVFLFLKKLPTVV